jgi:transmembrane sensor
MDSPGDEEIRRMAAAWLARLDSGASPELRAAYERWKGETLRRRELSDELEWGWQALGRPREAGAEATVARILGRRRRRRWAGRIGSVAAVCVAAVISLVTLSPDEPVVEPATPSRTATIPGARVALPDRLVLPDGSVVERQDGTDLEVDYSPALRRLRLRSGAAHFSVAADAARPFVVELGGLEVRALGTVFAVRVLGDSAEVVVTEGRVALAAERSSTGAGGHEPTTLAVVHAGDRAVVTLPEEVAVAATIPEVQPLKPAELSASLEWRIPRLEFTRTSLPDAARLFNSNGEIQIEAADERLGAIVVSGVFRADNVEGFVALLVSTFGVKAERVDPKRILLRLDR